MSPLPFEAYADAVADAAVVLRENAARAGLDAAVPTCPGWDVRRLVVHQGGVHRWATATLLGERTTIDACEQQARDAVDVLDWLADGAADLLRALDYAPDDLDAWFFLPDAPAAKRAWARRQCHETTIHAVDAMAAATSAPLETDALWFGDRLARDGVDELLTGFLPRVGFRPEHPGAVTVLAPEQAGWLLDFSVNPVAVTRDSAAAGDTTVSGTPVDLYLGLWNRGDSLTETGRPLLRQWHEHMVVG